MRDTKITDLFPEAAEEYEIDGEPFNPAPGLFVLAATILSIVLSIDLLVF